MLDVITKMPGHFRDDYMLAAGIKRAMWNKLSGELRRNGSAYAERATVNRNGKTVTDFRWYAGKKPTGTARARKTSKTPPAVRRGQARASTRKTAVKSKPVKAKPTKKTTTTTTKKKSVKKSSTESWQWTPDELELVHNLWKEGLTDKQISAKIGRTAWAIRGKRKAMRWVAERGKQNPHKEAVKAEPLYEVTIVEHPEVEMLEDSHEDQPVSDKKSPIGEFATALADFGIALDTRIGVMMARLGRVEKRLATLEDSLKENSKADEATVNVIGELEKALSALKGNL